MINDDIFEKARNSILQEKKAAALNAILESIKRAKKNAGEIGKKRPPPRGRGKIQRAGKPSVSQENAGKFPRRDMITIQNTQFRTESQELYEKKVKKSEKKSIYGIRNRKRRREYSNF